MNITWSLLLCLGGTALTSAALLPGSMAIAPYIGAVDVPRDGRRMHTHPIPRCGGMALFFAVWGVAAVLGVLERQLLPLLIATTILTVLGLFDDIFGISAPLKLAVQLLACLLAVRGQIDPSLYLPAVLWLTAVTNAHNMIDGCDGVCASVVAAQSVGAFAVLWVSGDRTAALLALGTLGCCLGYLPYNVHPARVFMGDEGALFLGLIVGWLSLRVYAVTGSLLAVLLLCALPTGDLAFAVVRRLLKGQNPLRADRAHLHHRLRDLGLSQRLICLIMTGISLLATMVAVWLSLY
jgi:UDP-GlcNAc:undecaprenyl-phosphate GlcNAc-1-phosphate transferase